MTFEEQINQTSFYSPFHKAILNLKYTANWFNQKEAEIFKKHNILTQHFNVLRIVLGADPKPVSPGQIISVMIESGRDLTRLVDKLVKLGYLDRSTCPTNRRKVDIKITDKGRKITEEVSAEINAFLDSFDHVDQSESEQLSDLLDVVRNNSQDQ